jgi:hypothetical protein
LLSYQSLVGKGLALGGPTEDEAEEFALAPAAVEAVDELGQVAREVLSAHAVEGAGGGAALGEPYPVPL